MESATDLVTQLTRNMDVHVRRNKKCIRVHGGNSTVAEIVVGDNTVRLNMREFTDNVELVALAEGIEPTGHSKTWKGGGVKVTPDNVAAVRQILEALVQEARIEATRIRTVRESLAILERAKKDGLLSGKLDAALKRLLETELAA